RRSLHRDGSQPPAPFPTSGGYASLGWVDHLERAAEQLLPGLLLLVVQLGLGLGERLLGDLSGLLHGGLAIVLELFTGRHLREGLLDDRLDLALLTVRQIELLLDLGIAKGYRPTLLFGDLFVPCDLYDVVVFAG